MNEPAIAGTPTMVQLSAMPVMDRTLIHCNGVEIWSGPTHAAPSRIRFQADGNGGATVEVIGEKGKAPYLLPLESGS